MLLSQITTRDGRPAVVMREGTEAHEVQDFTSTLDLAQHCIAEGRTLA